jgi:drug/metabolite transporter (DMT)-like permease
LFSSSLARLRASSAQARAVLYMMAMVTCFSVLETTAKFLSRNYPVPMIVWSRYFVHTALMVLLLAPRLGLGLVRTARPGGQLVRAALLMGSTLFNFGALSFLPMAEVKAISFVSPLLVTILAVWLLSEQVGRSRWIAVAAGFAGVLFIVRPGSAMLQWPALLALGAASCYSLYQIMTRRFSATQPPMVTFFYTAAVGCVLMSPIVPFFWETPQLRHWPLFMLLGVAGGAGHYALIKAMQLADASFLSPLGYAQLLWATLFGLLVFGDFPDAPAFLGMAVIVASGLYVALGHRRKPREPETAIE